MDRFETVLINAKSISFVTDAIIVVNILKVLKSFKQDKYDIFQKLKDLNLHSIALRNVGVKIVRIFRCYFCFNFRKGATL